jgi:transcriptional regulator with XRE-family HTH domain
MPDKRVDMDIGKIEAAVQDQQDKIMGQVKTGAYLRQLRQDADLSLSQLGAQLGVSKSFLSAVEQGVKTMSDHFIRELSNFYDIDENCLYELLGRVPLLAREELDEVSNLQKLLSEIRRDKKLTDEKKQKLYDQMYKLYKNFPE